AGEASEDLEVAYTGDPITIGFNGKYLIEVLNAHAAGDTVDVGLTDEVGPGVVRGSQDPSYTYVLMPRRLGGELAELVRRPDPRSTRAPLRWRLVAGRGINLCFLTHDDELHRDPSTVGVRGREHQGP